MRVASDRRYEFDLPPTQLWSALTQVEQYRAWWPWLRHLDGAAFDEGSVWDCVVRPPLPYDVRFALTLEEVRAPSLVRATLHGDVVGEARLEVAATGRGSRARLVSDLAPGHGLLQAVAFVTLPLARFGHDWVLDHGAHQFRSALGSGPD